MIFKTILKSAFLLLVSGSAFAADSGFSLKDEPGKHLDVLLDGKLVARYMDAYDTSTPARKDETYKPYLTVFAADGTTPITNDYHPQGTYPHHRGIFIGFRKIAYGGKDLDRWGMRDSNGPVDPRTGKKSATSGEIVHQKFADQKADADSATFTSLTNWNDDAGKPFLTEERTMTFHCAPSPARLIIDFTSKLTAKGDCVLSGDAEHGGVQYRPTNDIDLSKTRYEFSVEKPAPHTDVDYPWIGESYTLKDGRTISVVDINNPANPKGSRWSAYRDYGRFGAFVKEELKAGESCTLKYRFLIADGEMPAADLIQKVANQYTGESTPTPKVAVLPADPPKAPKAPKNPPVTK